MRGGESEKDEELGMNMYPRPQDVELHHFIEETHAIERLPLSQNEINDTLLKKTPFPNAFAAGHFSAINFLFKKLIQNPYWPAKHTIEVSTEQKSDANLKWIRDLHERVMRPIVNNPDSVRTFEIMHPSDVGRYRTYPRTIGLDRPMPKPTAVKPLLHLWNKQLVEFHLSMAPKLNRPSPANLRQLNEAAYKFHLQLQCIHPFMDGTGRVSRLTENALRLRWGLPWKVILAKNSVQYVHDIMNYEDSDEWQNTLKDNNAKITK